MRTLRTLSKPPGLPVFAPHGDPSGDCLLARLMAEDPARASQPWPKGFEGGILHRLDVATSGAVALADDPADLDRIRALFRDRRLTKRYRLIVARDPAWDDNVTAVPLAHDRRRRQRMIAKRGQNTPHRGKWLPAETAFRRVRGRLFEAEMRTGVMHQIRVHAAFLGIPLLGDRVYGGGPPPAGAEPWRTFFLHHLGFVSADPSRPDAVRTATVADPPWAAPTITPVRSDATLP